MSVAAIETRRSMLLTGWCLLAAIVLALVIAVGVSVGELAIPLQNVFYAISNRTGLTAEPLNRIYESVIWDFRLSRALVAACCGAGLAICGVVLQSLLKNCILYTTVAADDGESIYLVGRRFIKTKHIDILRCRRCACCKDT